MIVSGMFGEREGHEKGTGALRSLSRCLDAEEYYLGLDTFIRLRRRPWAAYSTVVASGYEGWISPWMNAQGGPAEARRAKAGASADSAEKMKDTQGVYPGRLHLY